MTNDKYNCPFCDLDLESTLLEGEEEHCGICGKIINSETMIERPDLFKFEKTRWDGGCGRYLCETCHELHVELLIGLSWQPGYLDAHDWHGVWPLLDDNDIIIDIIDSDDRSLYTMNKYDNIILRDDDTCVVGPERTRVFSIRVNADISPDDLQDKLDRLEMQVQEWLEK